MRVLFNYMQSNARVSECLLPFIPFRDKFWSSRCSVFYSPFDLTSRYMQDSSGWERRGLEDGCLGFEHPCPRTPRDRFFIYFFIRGFFLKGKEGKGVKSLNAARSSHRGNSFPDGDHTLDKRFPHKVAIRGKFVPVFFLSFFRAML